MKDVIDLQYKNVAQRKASVELREDLIKAAKIVRIQLCTVELHLNLVLEQSL